MLGHQGTHDRDMLAVAVAVVAVMEFLYCILWCIHMYAFWLMDGFSIGGICMGNLYGEFV